MRGRIQSGYHHFCIRGNNRYNVFYDDVDKILFLILLDKYLIKFNFTLMEFVIMDNHFHALLCGENISLFSKVFIRTFSYWHNQRHQMCGKVFQTPFASWPKFTHQSQIQCGFYILQNPLAAKMCNKISEYRWSSYTFHHKINPIEILPNARIFFDVNRWANYMYANTPENERKKFNFSQKNPIILNNLISVDTIYIDSIYSPKEFINNANNLLILEKDIPEINQDFHITTTNGDMKTLTCNFLHGRALGSLNHQERKDLIIKILTDTNATPMQISKYLHENYLYIWRLKNRFIR